MIFKRLKISIQCLLTGIALIPFFTGTAYGGTTTYSISQLGTELQIPSDMAVFTRNVTSSDSNLNLINSTADELRIMFEKNFIYLEAIPKETTVQYELVVSGKPAETDSADFESLPENEFNQKLEEFKRNCEAVATNEVNSVTPYRTDSAAYFVADFKSTVNQVSVYVKKYYTIKQGKEISFVIQSKEAPLNEDQSALLQSMADTATYKKIKSSALDSPIFSEITSYLLGFLLFFALLGIIIFLLERRPKKKL